jgi:putative component of membrane protein insertase Oxa1/YidC/SpoIIIJ protein YidD
MLKYLLIKTTLCMLILIASTTGWGGAEAFEPWGFNGQSVPVRPVRHDQEVTSLPARMALAGINFFSEYVSRVDGDRCPMYPTCASYGRQAFRKHGFLTGVVMTADRLIHENTEMEYAPLVKVGTRIRYYDPVSNNDFWWYKGEDLDK